MATLVLVSEAEQESEYSGYHIRYLVREGLVKGRKQRGIWLVDLEDLKRYEQAMKVLGPKRFDPTRGKDQA
jgi:hypothetical protein